MNMLVSASAVAAAVTVPSKTEAAAPPLPMCASGDPIFAAIERHRLAHEACEAAHDDYNDLSELSPAECRLKEITRVQIATTEGTGVPIYATHLHEIQYLAASYPECEQAVFIARSKKALAAARRKRTIAARKAGITAAWDRFCALAKEEHVALAALVETSPTTRLGAAAAVSHVVQLIEDDRVSFDDIGPELTEILKASAKRLHPEQA
jgi:hypothetical protein